MTLHVLYLAHDLADAAIRRRVLTLKAGGAEVTVVGFQRGGNLVFTLNDDYWGGKAAIKEVVFRKVTEDAAQSSDERLI